ncbi:MAG TPA: hypothetical protein VKF80_10695 [Candidatus Eisenbacteria bacterium]|nr:hypothetical protein [Candidatus Eisenbacteria bacterium]
MRLRTLYVVSMVAGGTVLWGIMATVLGPLTVFLMLAAFHTVSVLDFLFYGSLAGCLGFMAWLGWKLGIRAEARVASGTARPHVQRRVLWALLLGSLVLDASVVMAISLWSKSRTKYWKGVEASDAAFRRDRYQLDTLFVRSNMVGDVDTVFVGVHGKLPGTYRLSVAWVSSEPFGDLVEVSKNLALPSARSFQESFVFHHDQLESHYWRLVDSTTVGKPSYSIDSGFEVRARLDPLDDSLDRRRISERTVPVSIDFAR